MPACKKDSDCPNGGKGYFCNRNGIDRCALRKKGCSYDGDCPADQFCNVYLKTVHGSSKKCMYVDYEGDYAKIKAGSKPPKTDCSKYKGEKAVGNMCGELWREGKFQKYYCDPGRYCSSLNGCSKDSYYGSNTGNPNRMYSFNYVPKECQKKLSSEIALEEYGFEEHERSYSGSEILVTMGAGMVCGALLVWYTRRNDKSLYY